MKNLILVPFLVGLIAGCGGSPADLANDTNATAGASSTTDTFSTADLDDQPMESVALDIDQAGIITIGMSLTEVYEWFDSTQIQKVPEKGKKSGTPLHQTYTLLSTDSIPLMSLSVSSDTITGIIVQNPAYQTEKGIGVGSTFSQLSREYHIASIIVNKDKQVIATVEELQKKEV